MRILSIFLLFSNFTFSAIYFITPTGQGNLSGTSWQDAYSGSQLQFVIDNAETGDQIWVQNGTYFTTTTLNRLISFHLKEGVQVYGSFVGTEISLLDRNLSSGVNSILSGELGIAGISDNAFTVVYNEGLSNSTVLDGFEIRDGNDDRSPTSAGDGLGGGIYNHGFGSGGFCSPTIRNCVFINNSASWGGGAFNNAYDGGLTEPIYINCVFYQNHAYREAGGMDTYAVGGVGNPILYNCVFYENTSDSNVGGMYAWGGNGGSCNPILRNCVFVRNQALNGNAGAFISDNSDENGGTEPGSCTVVLENCIVRDNFSSTNEGPQFYLKGNNPSVVIYNSNINLIGQTGNLAPSDFSVNMIDLDPLFGNVLDGPGPDLLWMTEDDGLQLLQNSPCIDTGVSADVYEIDLLQKPRISNGLVDMGAYEFQSTLSSDNLVNDLDITIFPNPANDVLYLKSSSKITSLILNSTDGRCTGKFELQHQSYFDIKGVLPGIYYIEIEAEKKIIRKYFIKN